MPSGDHCTRIIARICGQSLSPVPARPHQNNSMHDCRHTHQPHNSIRADRIPFGDAGDLGRARDVVSALLAVTVLGLRNRTILTYAFGVLTLINSLGNSRLHAGDRRAASRRKIGRKAVAVRWSIKARLTRRDRRKGREENYDEDFSCRSNWSDR